MKRIALRLPDDGVWTGGVNYVETVCRGLLENPDFGYEPIVFCSPSADMQLQSRFAALLRVWSGCLHGARTPRRPDRRLARLQPRDRRACGAMSDVILEAADFYGWRFPAATCPGAVFRTASPHRSHGALAQRSLGLQLQLAAGRTVPLSSEDARKDCEKVYLRARGGPP
jgi:hypothetical protein